MGNLISDRVAFFLKDHPPFSFLTSEQVDGLSSNLTVKYFNKSESVFSQDEDNKGFVYVLRKGNVRLFQGEEETLLDQCEPGDIFGVRSALTGRGYQMTARAEEESLLYMIELQTFQNLITENQQFSLFFASGYAAGQIIAGKDQKEYTHITSGTISQEALDYSKNVLTATVEHSVKDVANLMRSRSVGSIVIVDAQNRPLGILTDTDLRNKVVAEGVPSDIAVTSIMSSQPITAKPSLTLSEAQICMMNSKIHHLILTEDGTTESPVVGIVSDHDILMSGSSHPSALIKKIRKSDSPEEWKIYRDKAEEMLSGLLDQQVSIPILTTLITAVNDAIVEKAVAMAVKQYPEAEKIDFCWLSLGSEGREEQLLRTDQDNAIIFRANDDVADEKKVLDQVGEFVVKILVKCGFEECPAQIMATNDLYCQSAEVWKRYFKKWINNPDPKALMNATIFFDFRGIGDRQDIQKELKSFILNEVSEKSIFLNFLAQNALQNPPPLSFFNKFLVENTGEHRDQFDIKKRAMMPLSDAARLLVLEKGNMDFQSTLKRFEFLERSEPANSSLYQEARQSYELFLRLRAKFGIQNRDSGRFIIIDSLNKLEKQMLKNAFLTIKELQKMIEVRFQLSYFN